jgi:hypothetical protein
MPTAWGKIDRVLTRRLLCFISWDLVVFIGLVALWVISSPGPLRITASIVFPDSSASSLAAIASRNSILVPILTQNVIADRQLLAASEDGLRQTRTMYVIVIAALVALVFTKTYQTKVLSLILVVIIPFCFLDVQIEDLMARQEAGLQSNSNALEKLANLGPIDSTRYFLDHREIQSQFEQAIAGSFNRKVYRALHPNADRIVFYVLPWVIAYMAVTMRYRKAAAT